MVCIGVDYGDARTGIAVSYDGGLVLPLCTLDSTSGRRKTAAKVAEIAAEKRASKIVIGYPKNMDGTAGKRAVVTEKFATVLKAALADNSVDAVVDFFDERLTSKAAESALRDVNLTSRDKGPSDQVAAAIILTDYIKMHQQGEKND